MIAGAIEGNNCTLRKPGGMTDAECHSLVVRVAHDQDGYTMMQSAWHPTPAELKRLNSGAPVVLSIYGTIHPPVNLLVGEPTS